MWAVVFIAEGTDQIQAISCLLQDEGILCRVRYLGTNETPGSNAEILVPQGEAEEASTLIHSHIF